MGSRFLLSAALVVAWGGAAAAQSNPTAAQLVNELKPLSLAAGSADRGIKPLPPGGGGAAPTPTPAAAPSANINVDFASGSAVLTPGAMSALDQLGEALTNPALASSNFRIAGHTDTVGDSAVNQALSEQRAAAVKAYLEAKYGIAESRLQAVGVGEADLLVPTPPQTANEANRRVEVINIGQ
jgi:outer membrane protein OmpA-like peptidoglycan-associated protein